MQKYNLSKIMKRAWELVKTAAMTMSTALRQAWAEAKKIKKEFTGYAEIDSESNSGTMYSFRSWKKHGKNRIYCNYRGRRPAGHIDLDRDNAIVTDCPAYANAMREFLEIYRIA